MVVLRAWIIPTDSRNAKADGLKGHPGQAKVRPSNAWILCHVSSTCALQHVQYVYHVPWSSMVIHGHPWSMALMILPILEHLSGRYWTGTGCIGVPSCFTKSSKVGDHSMSRMGAEARPTPRMCNGSSLTKIKEASETAAEKMNNG